MTREGWRERAYIVEAAHDEVVSGRRERREKPEGRLEPLPYPTTFETTIFECPTTLGVSHHFRAPLPLPQHTTFECFTTLGVSHNFEGVPPLLRDRALARVAAVPNVYLLDGALPYRLGFQTVFASVGHEHNRTSKNRSTSAHFPPAIPTRR